LKKHSFEIDDLDRRIIKELQRNGRMTYKMVAKKLKVSDGTVRFRVKRLLQKKLLKISASINPFLMETSIAALVGMQLEKRTHKQTMGKIAGLKGVVSVCNVTGEFDLVVEVLVESREGLNKFLVEDLSKIEGIQSTQTFIYLDAINKWIELA
jgi:DNA-binding Lrp family transcriptional regulator